MPFVEITGVAQQENQRRELSAGLTRTLADAFSIAPEIVTIYFLPVAASDYAHAGVLSPPGEIRNFIKVHAFPRAVALKRRAAQAMTAAFVAATQADPKIVVIYFFDRDPQDVSHGGILASD
jgi:phenylpyruvate tautomerase PptA (4-oxalocrotonate tautomerase family)